MATSAKSVQLEGFHLGPFVTNCYLLHTPPDPACWIIDAGQHPQVMIERIRTLGLRVQKIILTHAHVDHILGLPDVRAAFPDVPVMLHGAEWSWLGDPMGNLSGGFGEPFTTADADEELVDGMELTIGGATFEVWHTPGHSPGSVSLIERGGKIAVVGDTLFAGSIGRTDFPTSDHEALVTAIRDRLYALEDDVIAYPGHGPHTTIGQEKRTNPFVRLAC